MKSRFWWLLGLLLLAGVISPFVLRVQLTHAAAVAWDDYERKHRPRDIAVWQAPSIPDADNFAAHPWMAKLCSDPENADETIRLWHWWGHMEMYFGKTQKGETLFDGRPQDAREALEDSREYQADFHALREAAARPHCRLPDASSDGELPVWQGLPNAARALACRADAALAAGEIDIATADLEALLRIGKHLRSQHLLLASAAGQNMEKMALEIIALGQARNLWPAHSKRRLVAAMRDTPLEDELAALMHVERATILDSLDKLKEETDSQSSAGIFWYPPARIIALNKIYVCKKLEPILAGNPSREDWMRFEEGLYSDPLGQNLPEGGLGLGFLKVSFSIIPELFEHEDKFLRSWDDLSK